MNTLKNQKNAVKWLRIVYPVWALVGMFSLMYVPSQLIDISNPVQTVANIENNTLLFRFGVVGSLLTQLISIAAVCFLYRLFYQWYKEATILMALLIFLGIPIAMVSTVNQLTALSVIDNAEQVVFYLKLNNQGTTIASIFWGLWLLPLGYMIIKSPLFPTFIGWLVVVAGVGYTLLAFAHMLDLKGWLVELLDYLTFGEVLWMLWVLIMGAKWKAVEK